MMGVAGCEDFLKARVLGSLERYDGVGVFSRPRFSDYFAPRALR